ncbi:MAG: SpoIIE family protein phosphatase [Bacteroidales bacterium]|nr:SpoIIE family protein phosphatase [Bacteroidales bacterium]
MNERRTTIFRQLILNIVFPVVVALLLLAIINYWHSNTNLKEYNENKNFFITDEITHIHEFQDLALEILENNLEKRTQSLSEKLVNNYFRNTKNIEKQDLNAVRRELRMDPELEDIYIINREGRVVNTTFLKDTNLNLFDFGEEHKNYLLNVFNGGKYVGERIAIEASTKRLKKYTYQPTLDGKYIIELGVYSEKADEIVEFIRERLVQLSDKSNVDDESSKKQSSIVDVDVFIGSDAPFSLYKKTTSNLRHKDIVTEVFDDFKKRSVKEKMFGQRMHYEYIYMPRKNTDLYKGSVIQIVSNRTNEVELLRNELFKFLIIFGFTILIVIYLIYKRTRIITDPIKKLVDNVNRITSGHLDERADVIGNNEITSLSEQFNIMIEQLESYYNELEEKVRERTYEIYQQKEEIEAQRDALEDQRNMLADKNKKLEVAYKEIEQQKKNITDSIIYAKRIQNAILPSNQEFNELLPDSFIFFKPRDIVSGDFYWLEKVNNHVIVAAVDCTGHGVPGAFMSIVGHNQLHHAVEDADNKHSPADILNKLNYGVTHTLKQTSGVRSVKDGMDVALCSFNDKFNKVEFAGAFNPLILVRDNEIIQVKGDKFPIGAFLDEELKKFTNHEMPLKKGDMLYIFSDGYVDQFGGDTGRKFLIKNFKDLLLKISKKPLNEQKQILKETLDQWKKGYPQIDDILIIGIKI